MVFVRKAVKADEAAIRACAEAALARYIPLIGRRPAPMDADFAAQITACHVHVATDPLGHILGYVSIYPVDDHLYLDALAIIPRAMGQGLGKRLISLAEDKARALGLAKVQLCTNAKMVENLAIYPHLGYQETGRGFEDGFDRVFFEKRI